MLRVFVFIKVLSWNMLVLKKILLSAAKTHSNNSKIPEKIKKNRIFCITNLIKTVIVDIISNKSSFIILLLDAEPLIVTQKTIPKSINKLTGIVNTKNVNKNKAPIAHIKILFCKSISDTAININKLIVSINSITKKK
mgnify:FL=1